MEQSTVGEFSIRLEIILAFHCHLLHATGNQRMTSMLLLITFIIEIYGVVKICLGNVAGFVNFFVYFVLFRSCCASRKSLHFYNIVEFCSVTDLTAFSALRCSLGGRKGIRPVKN